MEVQIQQNDERVKLSELIERIKVGMPTTLDDQESLRSRPLQTLEVDAKCGLWFFVSADSAKVGEIDAHQQHVSLSYADAHKQDYLSISGSARLARDRAHMQLLWTPVGEGLVSARSG